jgi:hypothetical protein
MLESLLILPRMRNASDKTRTENYKTQFTFHDYFLSEIFAFIGYFRKYFTAWQATVANIIRRMRIACWITKATNTHWVYVILFAFPRQHSIREWDSMLHLHYAACHFVSSASYSVRYAQECTFIYVRTKRATFSAPFFTKLTITNNSSCTVL